MKKVLFVIPTLVGGGAERVLVNLLNNLDKRKYDITLFTLFDTGVNKKYLNEDITYKYYFKKLFRGNIHFLKLFSPEKLYRMMIKDEYDIIISYLEGPTTRIVGGCSNKGTKLLNWVHTEINNPKDIIQSYRSTKELIDTYNKFNATIFVSNTAREAFRSTFKNVSSNMFVKNNTVDSQLIKKYSVESAEDVEFDENKFNLISVGRFTQPKGYERLLRIVGLLNEDGLNVHLYLLGKGELETKYRKIINENGLNENVTILGFKDNPYKYVRKCDLFVCSSHKEGYSTAVTESLIIGTPVVTTLCSGMEELLGADNEYGLITDNDEEALYKGIKYIISEPGLLAYYKQRTIERGKLFNTEKTVKSIEEILDSI